MILSLRIALKFHRGPHRNILLSFNSFISIICIIVTIIIAIVSLSIVNGFKNELSKRILSIIPHCEIEPIGKSFINWQETLINVQKISNVIYASPYVNFSGIIEYSSKWHLVYIKSVNLFQNYYTDELLRFISKDVWKNFCEKKNQIIIGQGVSCALKLQKGDWVTILIADHHSYKNKLSQLKKINCQISGILDLNSQLDNNLAIISFIDAQCYNNNAEIQGILVKVKDVFTVNKIKKEIKKKINDYVRISTWIDIYGYIYRDIQTVRVIIYLSIILMLGMSCFNVFSMIYLSVKNKNYDIVVLRMLGVQHIFIQYLFLWYGLIIYFFSGFFGLCVGICISYNINNLITACSKLLHNKIMSENVYFINFLPVQLNNWDILITLFLTLLFGLLVSFYAVSKIKKVNLLQELN